MGIRTSNPVRQAALVAAAAAMVIVSACGGESSSAFVGHQIAPAPQVGALSLTDTSTGTEEPLQAEPDDLLVAFLGFTNCPDACPLALSKVSGAFEELGDKADRVDVAMVTVDPQRDTPEVLTEYVRQFVDDATGLRTEDEAELQAVSDAFGATYETTQDHEGMTAEVGHTDYTYVIDDTGSVVFTWTADMTVDDMVNDLEILLDQLPDRT